MNENVKAMRDAIQEYYKAAKTAAEARAAGEGVYSKEYLAKKDAEDKRKLDTQKQKALEQIRAAQKRGRDSIAEWGRMDGSRITDDAKLLEYGVTPQQFKELVDRYQDNGTMLNLLQSYAVKNNDPKAGRYYDTSNIHSVEGRQRAYDIFADSAASIIDALGRDGFGNGINSPMLQRTVETFGEPGATNADLLNLL